MGGRGADQRAGCLVKSSCANIPSAPGEGFPDGTPQTSMGAGGGRKWGLGASEDRVLCSEKNFVLTATYSKCIVVKYSAPGCISRTLVLLFWLKILSPEKRLSLVLREKRPGRIGMEGEGKEGWKAHRRGWRAVGGGGGWSKDSAQKSVLGRCPPHPHRPAALLI